jgi:hypothetical protein
MALQRNYDIGNSPEGRLNRKIDQHMEMFSLAMADGDHADAARHAAKFQDYQQQLRDLRGR